MLKRIWKGAVVIMGVDFVITLASAALLGPEMLKLAVVILAFTTSLFVAGIAYALWVDYFKQKKVSVIEADAYFAAAVAVTSILFVPILAIAATIPHGVPVGLLLTLAALSISATINYALSR